MDEDQLVLGIASARGDSGRGGTKTPSRKASDKPIRHQRVSRRKRQRPRRRRKRRRMKRRCIDKRGKESLLHSMRAQLRGRFRVWEMMSGPQRVARLSRARLEQPRTSLATPLQRSTVIQHVKEADELLAPAAPGLGHLLHHHLLHHHRHPSRRCSRAAPTRWPSSPSPPPGQAGRASAPASRGRRARGG